MERHCAEDWLNTRSEWVEDSNKIYALLRRGFAQGVPASLRGVGARITPPERFRGRFQPKLLGSRASMSRLSA